MTREDAIAHLKEWKEVISSGYRKAVIDMAIKALSADAVSREEYEEVKAYMDTLVDAFIEDGEELAESVEVVRCKDCLMTKERDEYTNKVWCCRHREYMDDMYYCADGLQRYGICEVMK